MTEITHEPLSLTRRDSERNMARFYVLVLQPTLFGEVSVIRMWGRIGTRGQEMMETFNRREGAAAALAIRARSKVRRGYR